MLPLLQVLSLFKVSIPIMIFANSVILELWLQKLAEIATMWKSGVTQFPAIEGKKYHTCKTCGFSTMKISYLKSHLLDHSGEKPFSCAKCKYSCKRAGHLKEHMLIHSEERLFKCSQCNQDFKRAGDLKNIPHICHGRADGVRVNFIWWCKFLQI